MRAPGGEAASAPGLPPAGMIEVGGIPIACRDAGGDGTPILCLHETAATAAVWDRFAAELTPSARPIAYDRRGWGDSGSPEGYRGTSVAEHAEDAIRVLAQAGADDAVVCGAGFGALVAMELMLRPGSLVIAGILIEPPLLSLAPEATEGLSADSEAVEEAVESGGLAAAVDLYLSGGLPYLGAGARRIPRSVSATASEHPLSVFAEVAAISSWALRGPEMLGLAIPSRIVVGAATPPVLRLAAEELEARLGESALLCLGGEGLPHVSAAAGLAAGVASLA